MFPGIETLCQRLRGATAASNVAVCELACLQDFTIDFDNPEKITEARMKIGLVIDQLFYIRSNYNFVIENLTIQDKLLKDKIKPPEEDAIEKPEDTKQEENENG